VQIGLKIFELADPILQYQILKCQKGNYTDDMERRLKLRLRWVHRQWLSAPSTGNYLTWLVYWLFPAKKCRFAVEKCPWICKGMETFLPNSDLYPHMIWVAVVYYWEYSASLKMFCARPF